MRIDQVTFAVATPVGCVLLYFLFAGAVSGELIACAVTLAVACPYAVAVARSQTVPLRLSARGLLSFARALGAVPRELWQVGRALARPASGGGVVKHVPFRFGAFEPGDVGRRAAIGAAMSLAPNGIVLGMDHLRDELLVHQLADAPIGRDPEWPL